MQDMTYYLFNKVESLAQKQMKDSSLDFKLNLVEGNPMGDRLRKIWLEKSGMTTFLKQLKTPKDLLCYKGMQSTFLGREINETFFEEQSAYWLGCGQEELTNDTVDAIDRLGRHGIGFIQLIADTIAETERQLGIQPEATAAALLENLSHVTFQENDIKFNAKLGTHVPVTLSDALKRRLLEAPLKQAVVLGELELFKIDQNTFSIGANPGKPEIQIKNSSGNSYIACNNQFSDRVVVPEVRISNLIRVLNALGQTDLSPKAASHNLEQPNSLKK